MSDYEDSLYEGIRDEYELMLEKEHHDQLIADFQEARLS